MTRLANVVLLGTGMLASLGCSIPGESGFAAIRPGWTEADVRKAVGEPSVSVPGMLDEDGVMIEGPRWQYGDNLGTMTTAATFPRTVPDRVWVVWFDVDGLVLRTRGPVRDQAEGDVAPRPDGGRPETPLFSPVMPPRNR